MKKTLLIISLSFLIISLKANTFYGIIVVDVDDPVIGNACEHDADKMFREFKEIAKYNNADPVIRQFKREQFSKNELLKYLNKIEAGTEDILFFYYSGHGHYEEGNGKVLKMKGEKLKLKEVEKILERKLSQLKFIVTDCCNQKIPFGKTDTPVANAIDETMTPKGEMGVLIRQKNYQRLLNYEGLLIVESSQPGQYSYANDQGGIFTDFFLRSIHHHVEFEDAANWKQILDKTREDVENFVGEMIEKNQVPVSDDTNLFMKLNPGTTQNFDAFDSVQKVKN